MTMGNRAKRQRQSLVLQWVAQVARMLPHATFHATEQENPRYNVLNVVVDHRNDFFITHYWGGGQGPKALEISTPEDVRDYFNGADY